MRAYLDYNIFIAIEQGRYTNEEIKKVDQKINEFPFSASHIQEADNIVGIPSIRNKFIKHRLQTIKKISQCAYLFTDHSNRIVLQHEDPETVLETIRGVATAKPAMQMFMNLTSSDKKDELRQMLGIDSKELNNYKPTDVIAQLNRSLINWNTQASFLQIIENAIGKFPNGGSFGLNHRIAAVYELLDLCGYWKDRETETSNYARLWDATHAHFATFCDYFISDDKRNRNKAKVVYEIFGIKNTKIISSTGALV